MRPLCLLVAAVCVLCPAATSLFAGNHPLSVEDRSKMNKDLDETIQRLTESIRTDPKNVGFYARRGDALFFRGRFQQAAADYEKMVELNPQLDASHWRRGIAWFYAGQFKQAAHQFEIYNTFDNIDRENGIWRFFSQTKAYGLKRARQGLLKYQKVDRQPFPAVYKLFEEKLTPDEILAQIATADIDKIERERRLFYAELYIGLNYEIHGKPQPAVEHLRKATANTWGRSAGFGANYMWHVGRLHYELLTAKIGKSKHKSQ